MKKAFTMIELVIVIIVISILSIVMVPSFSNSKLTQAAHQVVSHIRYTQHLAMMDDKFDSVAKDSSAKESERVGHWFKQRWQIRFTNADDTIFYQIFSDQPTSTSTDCYNGKTIATQFDELAIDPLTQKYLVGNWNDVPLDSDQFPTKQNATPSMNLTLEYGIKRIEISNSSYTSSSMPSGLGHRIRILFDNFGRPYFDKGADGQESGNYNPYDYNQLKNLRIPIQIKLCLDSPCSANGERFRMIKLEPETGYVYMSN